MISSQMFIVIQENASGWQMRIDQDDDEIKVQNDSGHWISIPIAMVEEVIDALYAVKDHIERGKDEEDV